MINTLIRVVGAAVLCVVGLVAQQAMPSADTWRLCGFLLAANLLGYFEGGLIHGRRL